MWLNTAPLKLSSHLGDRMRGKEYSASADLECCSLVLIAVRQGQGFASLAGNNWTAWGWWRPCLFGEISYFAMTLNTVWPLSRWWINVARPVYTSVTLSCLLTRGSRGHPRNVSAPPGLVSSSDDGSGRLPACRMLVHVSAVFTWRTGGDMDIQALLQVRR